MSISIVSFQNVIGLSRDPIYLLALFFFQFTEKNQFPNSYSSEKISLIKVIQHILPIDWLYRYPVLNEWINEWMNEWIYLSTQKQNNIETELKKKKNIKCRPVPKITKNSYCTLLWRARGARAYNGGLGAEPLFRGSGGRSPPEAENLLKLDVQQNGKMSPFSLFSVFYKLLIISRHVDSIHIWLKWQDRFPPKWVISLADN